LFTKNGRGQFIDEDELPSGVNIGLRKLMICATVTTMLELIRVSNLNWILNSGLPPPRRRRRRRRRRQRTRMITTNISSSQNS
jgi:hypothetical protein